MSINAYFATYDGNPEKVNKDVSSTFGSAVTVQATRDINDLTCEFILDGHGYHGDNYMKVEWDGVTKYYFIEKREGMPGDMTKITATCDVLTTYASAINNAPAVIARTSSGDFNAFLKDEKTPILSTTYFSSKKIGDGSVGNLISGQEYFYVGVWANKTANNVPE